MQNIYNYTLVIVLRALKENLDGYKILLDPYYEQSVIHDRMTSL